MTTYDESGAVIETAKEVAVEPKKLGLLKRVGMAIGGALTYVVATTSAHAAELDFSGFSDEMSGIKSAILGVIGIALTVMGIVVAWSLFKRASSRA